MVEDLSESLFTCSCCYDLLVEPTTLMCGHSFCRICLARWYLESGKRECPECRQVYLGVPKVNIVLRSTIEKLFNDKADERLQDLLSDPSAIQKMADFEKRLLSAENAKPATPPRNSLAFIKGILFTFLSLGVVWFVSYVISPETDTLTQKPLAKWTMDEVCQWLQELGPWAEEELVPYFRHHGIDGRLLMVMNSKDLDELLNATETLHRRAFNMSLYSVRELGIKPPNGIWEYKNLYFGKALLLLYGLQWNVRTTLLLMCLFDFTDSFLPFIHVTVPIFENITTINLNTFQFDTPSASQWVEFITKWLFLPHLLVIQFIWARCMMVNWWTSRVQLFCCFTLTLLEINNVRVALQQRRRNRSLLSHLRNRIQNYFLNLIYYVLPVLLWNFIPTLAWNWLFYHGLYLNPFINLDRLRKRLRR